MITLSDAAHDQGQKMLNKENYRTDSVSESETPPRLFDGPLAEPELDTFELEVCTPYHGKPPHPAGPHVAKVRIVGPYTSRYQSRSPSVGRPSPAMKCRSPSLNDLPTGTRASLPRLITRSRSLDTIGQNHVLDDMSFGLVLSPPHFGLLHSMSNLTRVTQQLSYTARSAIPATMAEVHSARMARHSSLRNLLNNQTETVDAGPSVHELPWNQNSSLVGEVEVQKTRLIITKQHCLYPDVSSLIPYPSCLIGFHLVAHPIDPKLRVKHLRLSLELRKKMESQSKPPIIRAIYPLDGKPHETGERTPVHKTRADSIGVHLGVDQYGAATLSQTRSVAFESYTVACVSTSGVCTARLELTMDEDTSSKFGVDRSVYFAALLELESTEDKSFEATMTLGSKSRRELPHKRWESPSKWELSYDGRKELGHVEIQPSSRLSTSEGNKPINDQLILLSSFFCLIVLCCGFIVSYIKTS